MAAAVRSTIAIFPSAIAFGMGGATVDSTQHFVLQNLGAAADTFAITATALKDGIVPQVVPNSVVLTPARLRRLLSDSLAATCLLAPTMDF